MLETILTALGGLGLFLFGMKTMTSALKSLAGDRLHKWLARATSTPVRGVVTGATVTAVVQSSSATTVAAVGFVGAGLLTFEQSLGVIFGANIGTTVTGWIVALLGFKIKLGDTSLAIIFAGAMLLLVTRENLAKVGKVLCGFALLFLGVDYLKDGLSSTAEHLDFMNISAPPFVALLIFIGIGVLVSILTQSSSSTIASALVALNSDLITLPQTLAMIIGADIGTTVTALLATFGGSIASRRTGLSHVIYNIFTGIVALSLIQIYLWGWKSFAPNSLESSPEFVAVAFHTSFNLLGVLFVLPFTKRFAAFIVRTIKESSSKTLDVELLEPRLLESPEAAVSLLKSNAQAIATALVKRLQASLDGNQIDEPLAEECVEHINNLREFTTSAAKLSASDLAHDLLHGIDHLERLLMRLLESQRISTVLDTPALSEVRNELYASSALLTADSAAENITEALAKLAEDLDSSSHAKRTAIISQSLAGGNSAAEIDDLLDGYRWLKRVAYHLYRISDYLYPDQEIAG